MKTSTKKPISSLIENDAFPFDFLSVIGERESWRKDIHRPIYHIHKWWAKRLGSVFRGIVLGCLLPDDCDFVTEFYAHHNFADISLFDPFMGSGTTIGEAHKLGLSTLGRDINPVACDSVRIALGPLNRPRLESAFDHLSKTVGRRIRSLYQTEDDTGKCCEVMYYFWVKHLSCPHCTAGVDLFPSRVIARNAYPDRKPEVQVCCPKCGDIFPAHNKDIHVHCCRCSTDFDPNEGSTYGSKAICPSCKKSFIIASAVRRLDTPPAHRLFGKLVLYPDGSKRYLQATRRDVEEYHHCSSLLTRDVERGIIRLPTICLSDGHNTRQAISYNYKQWRDFFNDRQLLALGWLQEAISKLDDTQSRDALLTLFSGVLEFNNLFASYKGEGTGAVRHMFAHHILKPERVPLEANVWGTPKSSGSFSGLFRSRLIRLLDYREAPNEVSAIGSNKLVCSPPFSGQVDTEWPIQGNIKARKIYISCGSSDATGLPSKSIDLVITDPPFFDNVHYSELADFFYAWQTLYPRGFFNGQLTTRHLSEVQDADAELFASKLKAVFKESSRVLKDDGLLVFTYHHSRAEGWTSLSKAIIGAGFSVFNAHPIKSEMSVATPKFQAKEPIQLDVILVCKKIAVDKRKPHVPITLLDDTAELSQNKIIRLQKVGLRLSLNDYRVIVFSQFMALLGPVRHINSVVELLFQKNAELDSLVERLYESGSFAAEMAHSTL